MEIRTSALHHSERAYHSLVTTKKAQEDELASAVVYITKSFTAILV